MPCLLSGLCSLARQLQLPWAFMGPHHDDERATIPETWVLWNPTLGVAVLVELDRIEASEQGRFAWMRRPYEMVGPLPLGQLLAEGRVSFAACIVMSRRVWQQEQASLRRESQQERRRKANARARRRSVPLPADERRHRQTLDLPAHGALEPAQIKAAYRRLALRAHPDGGGDHELFIRVTAARDALLGCSS